MPSQTPFALLASAALPAGRSTYGILHKCTTYMTVLTSLTVACEFENYSRQQHLFVWPFAAIHKLKFREIIKHANGMPTCLCFTSYRIAREMYFHIACLFPGHTLAHTVWLLLSTIFQRTIMLCDLLVSASVFVLHWLIPLVKCSHTQCAYHLLCKARQTQQLMRGTTTVQ